MLVLILPAIAFQVLTLSCKCHNGSVKASVAILGSLLIASRGIIGYMRRQNGSDAFIYAVMLFLLVPLVQLLTFLKIGSFH